MITYLVEKLRHSLLARNAVWLLAGQGSSVVIQGLYFLLLARLLGTLQYGFLAGASAFVAIASQYSAMGSGLLLLRYVSSDHACFREYWGNVLLSIAGFGSILVIGLHFASHWIIGSKSGSIVLLLAVSDCICGQLINATSQVFQTFEKMRVTALLTTMTNLVRLLLAAGLLVYLHHASAWQWALASLILSAAAAGVAFATVTAEFGWPRFAPKLFFQRIREGFVFAVSGSTTTIYNDVDKVMLGHYGMNVANGIYTMAYRVVNIATIPILSIQSAAFPRFFREGVKGATATLPLAQRLLKRTLPLAVLSAAGMYFFAPLIPRLVGHGFSESMSAVRWLCLIPVFRCLHIGAGDAIAGAGYQRFRLVSQCVAAAANLGMNLYLIPHYAWFGAAVASLLTDGALAIMSWLVIFWLKNREEYVAIGNFLKGIQARTERGGVKVRGCR